MFDFMKPKKSEPEPEEKDELIVTIELRENSIVVVPPKGKTIGEVSWSHLVAAYVARDFIRKIFVEKIHAEGLTLDDARQFLYVYHPKYENNEYPAIQSLEEVIDVKRKLASVKPNEEPDRSYT